MYASLSMLLFSPYVLYANISILWYCVSSWEGAFFYSLFHNQGLNNNLADTTAQNPCPLGYATNSCSY